MVVAAFAAPIYSDAFIVAPNAVHHRHRAHWQVAGVGVEAQVASAPVTVGHVVGGVGEAVDMDGLIAVDDIATADPVLEVGWAVVACILAPHSSGAVLVKHGDQEVLVAVPHEGVVEGDGLPFGGAKVVEVGSVDYFYETVSGIGHDGTVSKSGVGHIGQIDGDT